MQLPRNLLAVCYFAIFGSVAAAEPWQPLVPLTATATGGITLAAAAGGALLAQSPGPANSTYVATASSPMGNLAALRLEVLTDPSLPANHSGQVSHFNMIN